MRLVASEVARVLGARLVGPDATAEGAGFDSRSLSGREMFVAVRAERDGHMFVPDALARGAAFALCDEVPDALPAGATVVVTRDTVAGLGVLARHHRRRLAGSLGNKVVGITGSVGKTSTKDFTVAALGARWRPVAASHKSFNNDLGVPVTVLSAPEDAAALVLEMGMRGMGEIARLCSIAEPVIGVVTAVADAHSELVGGIDNVARAKAELVAALPSEGLAVLNADDPRVASMARASASPVLLYGQGPDADVVFEVLGVGATGCCEVAVTDRRDNSTAQMAVPMPGLHMASNAAAAAAVAVSCDVPLADACAALGVASVSDMRMTWRRAAAGMRILDDTYNANPASTLAALSTLAAVPAGRRVAVLGYMAELADPVAAHRDIAASTRRFGIELIAVGTDLYGVAPREIHEIAAYFAASDDATAILVKGSRVAGLEALVRALVGN